MVDKTVENIELPTMYAAAHYDKTIDKVDVFLSPSLNSCVDKARDEWTDAKIYIYKPVLMTGDMR